MIGRVAYQNPWKLWQIDNHFFSHAPPGPAPQRPESRADVVRAYLPYIERQLSDGVYLRHMTRHMLGVFHGEGGAKGWRRYLSEHGPKKSAGIEVIEKALEFVDSQDGGHSPNSGSAVPADIPENKRRLVHV